MLRTKLTEINTTSKDDTFLYGGGLHHLFHLNFNAPEIATLVMQTLCQVGLVFPGKRCFFVGLTQYNNIFIGLQIRHHSMFEESTGNYIPYCPKAVIDLQIYAKSCQTIIMSRALLALQMKRVIYYLMMRQSRFCFKSTTTHGRGT